MDKNLRLDQYQASLRTLDRLFEANDVVYLSGPMTGIAQFNRPMFTRVKIQIARIGATVLSPADLIPADMTKCPSWEHQMRKCVRFIADCTKIVMLPGWENSRGALIEHLIAAQVAVPRWYLEENLLRASQLTMVKLDVEFMTRFMGDRLEHNTAEDIQHA